MNSLDEMLRPNRLALRVLGLWPGPMVRLRLGFAVVSLASLVGPQLYSVLYYWGDITYLAETGSLSIVYVLLLLKLLYVTTRRREFARLQRCLELFWRASNEPTERETFETPARIAREISILALTACLADYAAIVGAALLVGRVQGRRVLPVDVVCGFDYASDAATFASVFVAQMISLVYIVSCAVGIDATVLTAVLHVVGQFRLVNHRLRAIGARRETTTTTARCIGRCVEHHQFVVE